MNFFSTRSRTRSIATIGASLISAASALLPAHAEDSFPSRALTLVVPFATGGATDVVARMVGSEVSNILGQPVVIDNRVGAAGAIGAQHVARSSPDGYTLCFCGGGPALILKILDPSLPYDPATDLTPVSLTHTIDFIMAVNNTSPYKTLDEVVKAAQSKPDSVSYGSTGVGGPSHLGMESFNKMIDTVITHVPYKGESQQIVDLLGGRLDIGILSLQLAEPLVKEGKVRPLAIWSKERSPLFPEVPAVAESYPGFEAGTFVGVNVAAGTPEPIVTKLQKAFSEAINKPEIHQKMTAMGFSPRGTTSSEYADFLKQQRVRWTKVIDELDLAVDKR